MEFVSVYLQKMAGMHFTWCLITSVNFAHLYFWQDRQVAIIKKWLFSGTIPNDPVMPACISKILAG